MHDYTLQWQAYVFFQGLIYNVTLTGQILTGWEILSFDCMCRMLDSTVQWQAYFFLSGFDLQRNTRRSDCDWLGDLPNPPGEYETRQSIRVPF